MKLITTPTNNYLIDTRPRQKRFLSDIKAKVDRLTRVPRNSANVASQTLTQKYNFGYAPPLSNNNGFRVWGTEPLPDFTHFVQAPFNFKLINTNDVQLVVNLSSQAESASLTAPSTTYSVDFYYSIRILENNGAAPFGGSSTFNSQFYNTYLFCLKQVFTQNSTVNTFDYSFTNANVSFNLSDYIPGRSIDFPTGYPDFNTTPTEIMQFQLEKLINENTLFYIDWGYDSTSYGLLTGNNKLHFDSLIGLSSSAGATTFKVDTVLNFAGTFADYEPVN